MGTGAEARRWPLGRKRRCSSYKAMVIITIVIIIISSRWIP